MKNENDFTLHKGERSMRMYSICTMTMKGVSLFIMIWSTLFITAHAQCSLTASSNSPLCAGGSSQLQLSANFISGASYLWTGPNGFSSEQQSPLISEVSPAVAGQYILTVTGDCGTTQDTIDVVVSQQISNLQISSNGPVCSTQALNLTATEFSGASYVWAGPESYTSNGQTTVRNNISTAQAGAYTVTVQRPGCPPVSAIANIQVNPTPVAIASSNSPVCQGNPLFFSAQFIAGASYLWTGPNAYSSSAQNPSFSGTMPALSGIYTLLVTTPGCGSDIATIHVQVGANLTSLSVTGNAPVCENNNLILSASSVSGVTYQWSGPDGFTSNLASNTLSNVGFANAGVYTLIMTSPGCSSNSRNLSVAIQPGTATAGSNQPVCQGSAILFNTPNIAGASYFWEGPNGFTSAAQFPSVSNAQPAHSGTYTFTRFSSACTVSTQIQVTVGGTLLGLSTYNNSPVCDGNTLYLSASNVANAVYQWDGPLGFTSIGFSDSIPSMGQSNSGIYTLVVTSPGCGSTSRALSVNTQSRNVSISSNSPACEGSVVYFNAPVIANASYLWQGPSGFTSGVLNASVSNVQSSNEGIYSLSITTSNCVIQAYDTVVVGARLVGVNVSSNAPVCQGNTLFLSVTNNFGYTFQWSGPAGFTNADANPIIPNAQLGNGGVYSVMVSSPGCGSVTRPILAQVVSAPELVAPNWTVGASGDFPTLQAAIADANVVNGHVIQVLPGTYTVTSTLQINKQLTIIGDSDNPASVVFQTPNDGSAPTTMIQVSVHNVRLLGMTFRHRKTTASSVETAVGVSGSGFPQTRVNGFVMGHCRIEHVEFGLSIRGADWMIKDTEIAYAEFGQPANSTRRHVGVYGVSGNCFIDGVVFEDQTLTGNTRAITPTSTTGTNPNETYVGNLVIKNCTQLGRIQQFYLQDGHQGDPNGFNLWFSDNTINEYSVFVGFYGTSANFGNIIGHVNASGNNFSNAHNVQGKGMITADGSGTFRSTALPFHHAANTAGQTTYRADYSAVATISDPWLVGRSNNIAAYTVADDATLMATPAQPGLPVLFIISNNGPVCEGNVLRLSASSIPSATFAWTGPNSFTSHDQYPVLSNAQTHMSGVYTVSLTTSCGVNTGTTTVLIGAEIANVVSSSNAPLCEGTHLNLTVTNHSTYSILWSGPNGFTSSLANPTVSNVTNANAGVYTLDLSSPGCGSLTRTFNVPVTLLPVLSGQSNTPVCQGTPIYFTSSFIGDAAYVWSGPDAFTSSSQNPSMNNAQPSMAGIYTLIATSACGADTMTFPVQVSGSIANITLASNAPICESAQLNLSASVVTGAEYSWIGPDGFTSNLAEPVIPNAQVLNAGRYTLQVSAPGCVSRTLTIDAEVSASPVIAVGSNAPLCQGNALYLNASFVPGASYAWSGPSGYTSSARTPAIPNVQPLNSGVYTVQVSTQSCGVQTLTTTASIGASLMGANILVNAPVCAGQDIMFTATSNNSWSYAWAGPDGFTSSISNPTVSNAALINSGVYSLSISSPGCGSNTLFRAVTVNDVAVITPGSNSPVCQGSVLYLTTNGVTGATYQWSGPNGFVSTAMNPGIGNMQQLRAGAYSLTVNAPGCGTITATTQVLVTPSISGVQVLSNAPVCVNGNLQLSVSDRLHYTYSWTGPNGFTSTIAEPVISNVTNANQGTYTVAFTAPGCGASSRSLNVTVVNPASVEALNSGPACIGNAVYFTGRGPVGSTYNWTGPAAFNTNRQNPSRSNVQLIHAGEYTLDVNVPGCGIVSTTTTLVVNPCREAQDPVTSIHPGVAEAADDNRNFKNGEVPATEGAFQLQLSPNPATGNQVTLHWSGLESKAELSFVIYDITGKALDMRKVSESDRFAAEAHYVYALPETFAKGVYIIKSQQGESMHYLRFIIE